VVQQTTISVGLTELLSSLDSTKTSPQPVGPFTGEKPLRDSIPAVKLNERGPTEKNRDLLKAALQSAVGNGTAKLPAASASTAVATQPQEIPYQTLQKILE
jgi:hypothetical protein